MSPGAEFRQTFWMGHALLKADVVRRFTATVTYRWEDHPELASRSSTFDFDTWREVRLAPASVETRLRELEEAVKKLGER